MGLKVNKKYDIRKDEARKISRLEARVDFQQKRLFQKAANLSGLTFTNFLITALREVSLRVIDEHERLQLVGKDRQAFIRSLLNPPTPNDSLMQAAQRYRKEIVTK